MKTRYRVSRENLPGETLAAVLYWGGWAFVALSIAGFVTAITVFPGLYRGLYKATEESWRLVWNFVAMQVMGLVRGCMFGLVLIGMSGVIRTVNGHTVEMRSMKRLLNKGEAAEAAGSETAS